MVTLSPLDYVVLVLVLIISAAIGIYQACTGGKQSTTEEFFVADRRMQFVPVGFSLLASWMSAIAILGNPAEAYVYGTMYAYVIGIYIAATSTTVHFFIPVFYRLRLSSVYEYLQLRFSLSVRILGVVCFMAYMVMYLSVVLYAPSLATSAVTGISWWLTVIIVGAVCTFYTALGGIKAVIWTDVFQSVIMIACLLVVAIQGVVRLGGFSEVWATSKKGGRIVFDDISVDPTVRHSVWSILIGGTFSWLSTYAVNQMSIQRYLSCATLRAAKSTMAVGCPLFILFTSLSFFCGLVIYAVYADCDPLQAGYISKRDQLLPYYVINELGFIPGLPGLFVAAILSGTLSTVSSGLNSLAAVTVTDIVKVINKDMSDERQTFYSKVIATLFGVLSIGLGLAASQMGAVLQLCISLMGLIGGPLLGMFILGMFFPWANAKGAIVGTATGFAMAVWIGIGAFVYPPDNPGLPTSVAGCSLEGNMTTPSLFTSPGIYDAEGHAYNTSYVTVSSLGSMTSTIMNLYHVSYMYYGLISVVIVNVVGLIFSFLTGATDPRDVDPRLLTRVSRKLFCCGPRTCRSGLDCGVPYDRDEDYFDESRQALKDCKLHVGRANDFSEKDKAKLTVF